ncbi:MAG: dTDP-4-dehydrorhamnose 3,5-epimerase family protein [Acidimicrobiales bacterium]
MTAATITEFEQHPTSIEGLVVLRTRHADDERGTIREMYKESVMAGLGAGRLGGIKQVNLTYSKPGTIRGLHGESMAKLVGLAHGEGFGAYLDARPASPSAGTLVTLDLTPGTQVLVPPGVCNGFQAVGSQGCLYLYCFDTEWSPDIAGIFVHPLDLDVAVPWPVAIDPDDRSLLSAKDAGHPSFKEAVQLAAR